MPLRHRPAPCRSKHLTVQHRASLAQALLTHDRDRVLNYYTPHPSGTGAWNPMFHGQGVGIDDAKKDVLHYFQIVNQGLHAFLHEERVPLVVAAVAYLLPLYRLANTYPHLLAESIPGNPDHLSNDQLRERAWDLVHPIFQQGQQKALAQYRQLAGTGRTSHEVAEIVSAAYEGQLEALLVGLGSPPWGRWEPATKQVILHAPAEPSDEDLGNAAAVFALWHGRPVYVLGPEQMPDGTALAAVFRLPLAKRGKRP